VTEQVYAGERPNKAGNAFRANAFRVIALALEAAGSQRQSLVNKAANASTRAAAEQAPACLVQEFLLV